MKSIIKFIFQFACDLMSVAVFLAAIVSIVYVLLFASKHQYKNMIIALAAVIISILFGIGFSWLAAYGDEKRFQQNVINNFWINLLPPW